MSDITLSMRAAVLERAHQRCEYCQLSQVGQEAAFHIDHIVPRDAGGPTKEDNLALACVSCSLRKGAKIAAVDPETMEESRLFHPRIDQWADHFRWDGDLVVGISAIGRTTASLLKMNRPLIVAIRHEEGLRGRHPQK